MLPVGDFPTTRERGDESVSSLVNRASKRGPRLVGSATRAIEVQYGVTLRAKLGLFLRPYCTVDHLSISRTWLLVWSYGWLHTFY